MQRENPPLSRKAIRLTLAGITALLVGILLAVIFWQDKDGIPAGNLLRKSVYVLGAALLLGFLFAVFLNEIMRGRRERRVKHGIWFYPVIAGFLSLACMCLAYTFLGMWPLGEKTGMIVDMYHQYAPLLAHLRDMLLNGGNPLYSFEVGLGINFVSLFGYYLASPFNVLLVLFPEHLLAEGILVITLLKNALSGAFFAACVQSVYRRRNITVPMVSVMYALMMYMIAYSWNIMWLDVVMVLPLVVLGFEKLMRTGRYLWYILPLAYALITNYYIGFMLCIFLVLYYAVYVFRKKRRAAQQARSFFRFAVGSLLGGGLAMFLIVPVFLALGHTSAAGAKPPELTSMFDMFGLLGRHLYGATPTIRSGNLPNIYCGMLAVLLLPIFATLKAIPLRRRLAYIGLFAALGFSFTVNLANLFWHGMHFPNDLPYRFSFLYSFVLLLIAFETLQHLRAVTFKQVAVSFTALLAYLIVEEQFGDEAYGFEAIYISLLLLAVYAAVLALVSRKKIRRVRVAYALLCLVVTGEMLFHADGAFRMLDSQEHYTDHDNYVDSDSAETVRMAVEEAQRIGDSQMDGAFYRMELLPRRTCVDTALFGYRGITVFSSSNYYTTTRTMGALGYAVNGVNSHLYKAFVPTVDSLLGIRYLVMNSRLTSHYQLDYLDSVSHNGINYYIYENPDALPIGFVANQAIRDWQYTYYYPFTSQNTLFKALTGDSRELFTLHPVDGSNSSTPTAFNLYASNGQANGTFTVTLQSSGQTYVYADCGAAKTIQVSANGSNWSVSPREAFIIDAGSLQEGDTLTMTVSAEMSCSGNFFVATLNQDVYRDAIDKLSASGLNVSSFSDSHILGTIQSQGGPLFTSIPYDPGWRVEVDGEPVETYGVSEAFLAFDVPAGEHTVELRYTPQGLWAGIILSGVSLCLVILLAILTHIRLQRERDARLLARFDIPSPDSLRSPTSEGEGQTAGSLPSIPPAIPSGGPSEDRADPPNGPDSAGRLQPEPVPDSPASGGAHAAEDPPSPAEENPWPAAPQPREDTATGGEEGGGLLRKPAPGDLPEN